MIDPLQLLSVCREQNIDFFAGVPDSLLKDFCACILDNIDDHHHVIAANEGNAIGLGVGWFLGAGKPAMIYMQNSGLGNSVNPLISLADPEVYSIPMLLLVGWRGMEGASDEPQHIKQGRITPSLLGALEVPYFILDENTGDSLNRVIEACGKMRDEMRPVALLAKPGTFGVYRPGAETARSPGYPLTREEALKWVVDSLESDDVIISTTGKISRELYEYRMTRKQADCRDFLTVGSMGHASSIALGLSVAKKDITVVCLDGDGSVIMHMGSMAIIGQKRAANIMHIVLNNGSHDSVGGQPTAGFDIDLTGIAQACGYVDTASVSSIHEMEIALPRLRKAGGPTLVEIRVGMGARKDLGRPRKTPIENRDAFMTHLGAKRNW